MRRIRHGTALFLIAIVIGAAAPSHAEENPALVETLAIMRERGMIDEAKHAELLSKNQQWEAAHPALLSRLEWSADFRARSENFWFDEDELGNDDFNRHRGRYRLRIGARAKVNDIVTGGFRLASGEDDHRSTNTSFGRNPGFAAENDFGPDGIFIDQAYVELATPKTWLPEGSALKTIIGKQANPFLWKHGKDFMIWDQDITPEGAGLQLTSMPTDQLSLFGNAGYFIARENTSDKDPHVAGAQVGLGFAPTENFELGGRGSWYSWSSVDDDFLGRADDEGAITPETRDFDVYELAAYGRFKGVEGWPILLYGHFAQNLEADGAPGIGDEDTGWGAGVEVGDKKKLVMLGAGYYSLEANFSPAQFTDSDLFDGLTNREGWLVYIGRELFTNTELNVTLFSSDEIEDDSPEFDVSLEGAERYRLQTDLVVKF